MTKQEFNTKLAEYLMSKEGADATKFFGRIVNVFSGEGRQLNEIAALDKALAKAKLRTTNAETIAKKRQELASTTTSIAKPIDELFGFIIPIYYVILNTFNNYGIYT